MVARDLCGRHAHPRRRSGGIALDVAADRPERGKRLAAEDVAASATQLDALDQIDALKRIVDDCAKRTGRARNRGNSALPRGDARATGRSLGHAVHAGPGTVTSASPRSELWPLPTEPAAAPELKREAPPDAEMTSLRHLRHDVGTAVGSFLNVCIHRLPLRLSVVWPASAARLRARRSSRTTTSRLRATCWLRGRCRRCRAPISIKYTRLSRSSPAPCSSARICCSIRRCSSCSGCCLRAR